MLEKLVVLAVVLTPFASAILNGDIVEISDYPYAASVIVNNTHICGSSIVDTEFVLTAASCIAEYNATNLTVRAGSSFYAEGGQLVGVKGIHLHPNYSNPEDLLNNIAFLELNEPLVLNENVSTIRLDTNASVNLTGNGTIVGWGIVVKEENGMVKRYKPSAQLRRTYQPIVGQWTCQNTFVEGWDEDTMFCAGLYREDNCVGDDGNPFVFDGVQLGIASETLLMCGEFPTAYVNLTAYADYIHSFVAETNMKY